MASLGEYAVPVLSAYAVTMIVLAVLVYASWRQSVRSMRELNEAEGETGGS